MQNFQNFNATKTCSNNNLKPIQNTNYKEGQTDIVKHCNLEMTIKVKSFIILAVLR